MGAIHTLGAVLAAARGGLLPKTKVGHEEDLVPLLVAVGVILVVGVILGAAMLQAATSFHNKLVGGKHSPNAVPEPYFPKAMGITLVTWLVSLLAAAGAVF